MITSGWIDSTFAILNRNWIWEIRCNIRGPGVKEQLVLQEALTLWSSGRTFHRWSVKCSHLKPKQLIKWQEISSSFKKGVGRGELIHFLKEHWQHAKSADNFHLAELQLVQLSIHVPHCFTRGCGLASGLFLHDYIMTEFVSANPWDLGHRSSKEAKSYLPVSKSKTVAQIKNNLWQWLAVQSYRYPSSSESVCSAQPQTSSTWYSPITAQGQSLSSWQILIFSGVQQQPALVADLMEAAGQCTGAWLRFSKVALSLRWVAGGFQICWKCVSGFYSPLLQWETSLALLPALPWLGGGQRNSWLCGERAAGGEEVALG